jgi:branched-chain amino acid transport system substrate-binding protein
MRPTLVRLLGSSFLIFASLVGADAQVKSRLAIGVVLPLSGSLGAFGAETLRGIELAMSQLKEKEPDLAAKIDLNVEDSQSQTKLAETLTRKLAATRRADILIGELTSSVSYSMAKIAVEVQKPLIVPSASHSGLTLLGANIFRSCGIDDDQGTALAKFTVNTLKRMSAAIAFDKSSAYGRAIASSFEKSFVAAGGKVSLRKELDFPINHRDLVRQVKKTDAELLIAPVAYGDAAQLMQAIRDEGAKFKILGTDSWDSPQLFKSANKSVLKGHYYSTSFALSDNAPEVLAFVGAFKAKYQQPPSNLSAQGFDAAQLAFDAFRRTKITNSSNLIKTLQASTGVIGSGGIFRLDAQRNAKKQWPIMMTGNSEASLAARIEVND